MKNLTVFSALIACVVMLAGCTTPTIEEVTKLGTASGYTAAYVLNNQAKVDDATRNAIIGMMTEVEKYVPETNATYEATWTPIAKKYLDELKDKDGNPLPDATKEYVLNDFSHVVGLLDAYIAKKDINGHKDLTDAFIHAFFSSFLTNFKPANVVSAVQNAIELDAFTKNYLENANK